MPEAQIVNRAAAFGLSGVDTENYRRVDHLEASGAISAHDAVTVAAALTAEGNVVVQTADVSDDDPATVIGVALEAAADGEAVPVVTFGPAIVNVGDSTVTFGQLATLHATTDGAAAGVTAVDATLTGDHFGFFLSAEDVPDTDQAIVYVRQV